MKKENQAIIKLLLDEDGYRVVHLIFGKTLGWNGAVFFSYLRAKQKYFDGNNSDSSGWFYRTKEDIEKDIFLSPFQQKESLEKLERHKLIKTKKKGWPARIWYQINEEGLEEFLRNLITDRVPKKLNNYSSKETSELYMNSNNMNSKEGIINNSFIRGFSKNPSCSKKDKSFKRTKSPLKKQSSSIRDKVKSKVGEKKVIHPPAGKVNSLLEFWNILPNTPHHKNPTTKVYRSAVRLLRQMKRGKFGETRAWNNEWVKKNKIPSKYLNGKKWTDKELEEGLRRLALHFVAGYWPENKKGLPHTLRDLIYNPRTQTSWLLKDLCREPSPLKSSFKPDFVYRDSDYYNADGTTKKEFL